MPSKTFKIILSLIVLALIFNCGIELAYAADNESVISGGFGLSSVDSDLKRVIRGVVSLAKPIVTIMTAIAGMMVVLNIGGDAKQKIWNWILGIGLALNFGSVLWAMWGGYADIDAGKVAAAEYSIKVFDESSLTDGGIDTLSQFMKYYLTIVVAGALQIKPVAIKLLLGLALADMSIRLALDLTDKDKVSWMVKNFLKIGFYVFLINNWLGVDGLNLMDMLSKGFQEIGFKAGNYGEAHLTSISDIDAIDPKDNLAPDSIVNNMYKMFSMIYAGAIPQDASLLQKAGLLAKRTFNLVTSPVSNVLLGLSMVIALIVGFLAAVEMFMARIEFYTLALVSIPMLAFGVVKHFEYLAQQAIRAAFNSGVKVCVISFLQAVICQMFSKYFSEVNKSLNTVGSSTGTSFELLSITLQLLLMTIIMFLIVSKIPKLIQGLLSGNPSMSGSDMTGAVTQTVGTAASVAGMAVGAHSAAAAAKAAGVSSGWRMSAMGQFGAALLRRAPVIGTAYGAYQETSNFQRDNNTRYGLGTSDNSSPPPSSPSPSGGGGATSGGGSLANIIPKNNSSTNKPPTPKATPVSSSSSSSSQYSPSQQNMDYSEASGSSCTWSESVSGSSPQADMDHYLSFYANKAGVVNQQSNSQAPSNNNQNSNGVWRRRSSNPMPQNTPPRNPR